jgi:ATP-dependent Lon protease
MNKFATPLSQEDSTTESSHSVFEPDSDTSQSTESPPPKSHNKRAMSRQPSPDPKDFCDFSPNEDTVENQPDVPSSPPQLKRARRYNMPLDPNIFKECNTTIESVFMKEHYVFIPVPPTVNPPRRNITTEYLALAAIRTALLTNQVEADTRKPFFEQALHNCNTEIKDLIYTAREQHSREYINLLQLNPSSCRTEIDYFIYNLSAREQLDVIFSITDIRAKMPSDKPYRLRIIQADMPIQFKIAAMQKLSIMDAMNPDDSEYFKIKMWVDAFMRIPFGKYRGLDVSIADGADTCRTFLENARTTLDECVFGLADAKMQVMQMLGRWITNPSALGGAVAIHGPMGTGKTSIVKNGISKILGRDFAFISLGGASGASTLDGHSYTYEGSTYGKIVQVLMTAGSMNPVIYFDELDKISESSRGDEIASLLIHLTDPVQNSHFRDNYFTDVELDLSKCLFIFSYNDETKISPILRDRMYNIRTAGYSATDKRAIARIHLLPRICEQLNVAETEVVITDCALDYIIGNNALSKNESGVRNLNRCLEFVHAKLNLQKLMERREPGATAQTVNAVVAAVLLADMARDVGCSAMHSMYI